MAHENIDVQTADYFSIGIHPWQINSSNASGLLQGLSQKMAHPKAIALGEAGLDKLKGGRIDEQIAVFKVQAEMAASMKLPLIVHSVLSMNEVLQLKKAMKTTQNYWIIHGFNGSIEMAFQMMQHGICFSFGKHLIDQRTKAAKTIRQIPLEYIFFETDDAEISIELVYQYAANLLTLPIATLKKQIAQNFSTIFLKTHQ